jgi:hypothetical protein
MVDEFYGENEMPLNLAFPQRALYKEYAFEPYEDLNLFDSLYKNPYFGKVDYEGYIISLNEGYLSQFNSSVDSLAMNFVVDAFEEFRTRTFLELIDKIGVKNYNSVYGQMRVEKAWESTERDYFNHKNMIYRSFYDSIFSEAAIRKRMCNFKKFINLYFGYLETVAKVSPVTKIGFIKSNLTSINNSGLALQINDTYNASSDFVKKDIFLNDRLFDYFTRNAAKAGFSVDKNVPWRLVAIPTHPAMKTYLDRNDLTVENLFSNAYNRVYKTEYADFKLTIMDYYNTFVSNFPMEIYPSYNEKGKMVVRRTQRKIVTSNEMNQFPETYWLGKYFYFRNLEVGKILTKSEQKKQTRDISSFYKKQGLAKCLDMMERRFIKLHPLAIPKKREEYFDYGHLDRETGIYKGKIKQTTSSTFTPVVSPSSNTSGGSSAGGGY